MADSADTSPEFRKGKKVDAIPPEGENLARDIGRVLVQFVSLRVRGFFRLIGTLFVIGFSLLPLSALLIALPAVSPNEAVLSDTVKPLSQWWRRTARRIFSALAGAAVLVALVAFAIEVVSRLPLPPGGQ